MAKVTGNTQRTLALKLFSLYEMFAIFAFALFAFLIFIHELGHFLCAKTCGLNVLSFSFGMGKAIYKKQIGQTVYILRILPIGASIRTFQPNTASEGKNNDTDSSNDKKGLFRKFFPIEAEERALFDRACRGTKIVAQRQHAIRSALTSLAGPSFNVIFGPAFVFTFFLIAGVPTSTSFLTVDAIEPGSISAEAGLMVGDQITAIDGKPVYKLELKQAETGRAHSETTLSVTRQTNAGTKTPLNLTLAPKVSWVRNWNQTKVSFDAGFIGKRPWAYMSPIYSWRITRLLTSVMLGCVRDTFLLDVPDALQSPKTLGGLVRLADEAAPVLQGGVLSFLAVVLVMSFWLAIINMLPIPGFDGGQTIIYLIEAITKRPTPNYVQHIVGRAGLALMGVLGVALIGKDFFDYVLMKLF